MPTPADVIERIFTTRNPETGSAPPVQIAWAVFEHGTAYLSAPTDALGADATVEEVAEAARAALRELGPAHAGSASGDFRVNRLSGWYPDEPVWFIGFDSPALATVLIEELETDLAAGLAGRALRDRDHASMRLVAVRNFRGETA
ncbi:MAG TPA: hypothetical protein VKB80_10865 [Kofleriaceae bacterium]|nr:hypothetical protein [Kofleriaceae bacterium]